MSDVPMSPDLLAQILSRLPVTSLLRFRSVSKSFRALIDSNYVIKLHLNHSLESNSNLNLIFGGDRSLSYLNIDSSGSVVNKVGNPLYFALFETVILGSCNGVVCLCTTEPDNEVAFWNPIVRKFKKIRLPPAKCLEGFGRGICVKGFGYDHVSDDYKIVRLVQYFKVFKELVYSKIEVFSLKTRAWIEFGDFPYYLCYRRYLNVFANGVLHWLVSEKSEPNVDFRIAAFDLTKLELRLVPLPEFEKKRDQVQVNLAILGGCLSLVCNYCNKNVDIWVMKSYGVKESWRKLISTEDVRLVMDLDFLRPIVYSKNSQEVLLEKNFERFYWYHIKNKTVKRLKVNGMPRQFVTEVFTGSLFQVDIDRASSNDKNKETIENKNEKKRDDFLSKGFRLVL